MSAEAGRVARSPAARLMVVSKFRDAMGRLGKWDDLLRSHRNVDPNGGRLRFNRAHWHLTDMGSEQNDPETIHSIEN
jgi:hypothetical protein